MLNIGFVGVSRRKNTITTVRDRGAPAPDLIDPQFHPDRPQSAVGGRYHIYSNVGSFLYVAVLLDAFSPG